MHRLLGILLFMIAGIVQAEIAVVAGKDSAIASLDERQVADLFLAKTKHLSDGSRVRVFELSDNTYRASFYNEVAGKTLPQINSYWTTLIFTGKGKPPKTIDEAKALIELLNKDPNAISYLPLSQTDESLKILYVFH